MCLYLVFKLRKRAHI